MLEVLKCFCTNKMKDVALTVHTDGRAETQARNFKRKTVNSFLKHMIKNPTWVSCKLATKFMISLCPRINKHRGSSFRCLRRRYRTLTRHNAIARGKTPRTRQSIKPLPRVVWFEKSLCKGLRLAMRFAITRWMKAFFVPDSCRGSPNHGSLVLLSLRNKAWIAV